MLGTTFFHQDGSTSSTRTNTGIGSISNYFGHNFGGGSTFRVGNIATRISNTGNFLGSSLKIGNSTTYFGSSGGIRSTIPSFSRRR